ncbi:MAG: FIST C-terminal domain-containing protein, partial [Nannocystaceae bacterium]|nr:FIST C-terminal domain-containing protein [Nannocystaceae bacterium]
GGSAGDDLAFVRTSVICNGTAAEDRATVVLARSRGTRFKVLKHQHFTTESKLLAVTRADTAQRIIYELDGYPAAEAYARAIGVKVEDLGGAESFMHPFTFSCDGELYVRSFLSADDEDGSMKFYCAVEEGMVLQIGAHQDMKSSLDEDLSSLGEGTGKVDFMLNFNCVLRALEATNGEKWEALGESVCAVAKSSIGFDTYGEQLNGLHINQTLVAVAFSANSEEARASA